MLQAQPWVEKMQKPQGNFYEIKSDFEAYWAGKDATEKGKGYKVFKRWEHFVEGRVYPSGDLSLLSQTAKNYETFLASYQQQNAANGGKNIGGNNLIASATFTPMGPFGAISGNAGGQFLKSGRLNFVTLHPAGSNTLWVGAPAGGLWKSSDGGLTWTTNTDNLGVIGCSDLAIDPGNPNIMYLATGDGDAGDTRSIGVMKSTDGGATWFATGLSYNVTSGFLIRRLIINPSNTQILIAATNSGIFRTANAGTSWTQVASGSTHDLEFKPGNPSVVYAGGTTFRLSTDGGLTFTTVASGIATTGVNRMAVAVTPHDANYVYVLASNSSNSGFQGFYRSTNSGTSFSLMASTPNLLGWASNGSDSGGQGWYDLCTAASPLNKDEVVVGGVNVWRSTNGGSTWSLYGHWVGSGAPFTHADHHDLEYDASGTLFNANDGTIYKRLASSWQEICGSMNISQIYKMGTSSINANKWISGHQDNGTSIWTGSSYNAALGGDGMDCFFDRTNDNNVFGEYQNGSLQRSTNGGVSWTSATSGLTGTSPWVTVWKQDPINASTIYVGRTDLFKSTNLAVSWSTLTPIPGSGTIREFAIAPSNNQVIYVLKSGGIYKTTDGGATWSNVTGSVPVASALPEFIVIDPTDPNNAWVVLGGYSNGNKVFVTTNGGTSWSNYSANLPNIPGNCLIYQPGSNDRIYVGMDIGIYYRDATQANWTLYNQGLPNVPVSDFEISPASPSLLYAATYGRGVWVASLFTAAQPPVCSFSVTNLPKCEDNSVQFTDLSSNTPIAWSWSVNPSAGVVINAPNAQNPQITFPNGGSYTVTVVASNSLGAGSPYNQVVNITGLPNIQVQQSASGICLGSSVSFTASGAASYTWSNSGGNQNIAFFSPSSSSVYTVSGTSSGCVGSTLCSVNVYPLPQISINGLNSLCQGQSVLLMANGAATYTWNNGAQGQMITVSPSLTSVYTVAGSTSNGCQGSASTTLTVLPLPNVTVNGPSEICAGSNAQLSASGAFSYTWSTGHLNNSINVSPVQTTVYGLTGIDASGCQNTTSYTLSVNPLPQLSLSNNQVLACVGEQVNITANGAVNYMWQPGNLTGNPIQITAGSSSMVYTCTGTDANNCSASVLMQLEVSECLGLNISANGVLQQLQVYPNPNNGIVNIESDRAFTSPLAFRLFDVQGKLVMEKQIPAANLQKLQVDISGLAEGQYLLQLGDQTENRLLILKKD